MEHQAYGLKTPPAKVPPTAVGAASISLWACVLYGVGLLSIAFPLAAASAGEVAVLFFGILKSPMDPAFVIAVFVDTDFDVPDPAESARILPSLALLLRTDWPPAGGTGSGLGPALLPSE